MAKREFRDCNEDRLSQRFIIETDDDILSECHLYQLLKIGLAPKLKWVILPTVVFAIIGKFGIPKQTEGELALNRRDFTKYFIAAAAVFLPNHSVVGAVRHRYQLASESILPEGLRALLTRF